MAPEFSFTPTVNHTMRDQHEGEVSINWDLMSKEKSDIQYHLRKHYTLY